MITRDLHSHTIFCDGNNAPEEMVLSAIKKGLKTYGISVHAYQFFDKRYCIAKDNIAVYKEEINVLKEKYKDKIEILCGVEQDYYSRESCDGYDYIIGSVHYLHKKGVYIPIDDSAEEFSDYVNQYFDGDYYAFCEEYYDNVADVLNKTHADVIGHLDLVSKFNEGNIFFNEQHPRYVAAYKKAIDALIPYNVPFEINTGAISRGYKTFPYPNSHMMKYISEQGGKFILSSDAHHADNIAFQFEKWEKYAVENNLTLI